MWIKIPPVSKYDPEWVILKDDGERIGNVSVEIKKQVSDKHLVDIRELKQMGTFR